MSLPRSLFTILILGPVLACPAARPVTAPPTATASRTQEGNIRLQAPEVKNLQGTLTAETIRQVAAFKCEMNETQASITQSIGTYLSSRDEEAYWAVQSRIERITILTIHAKGMTKGRAESLVADIPHERVLRYGWDKVILANDQEGWIFDMAPSPAEKPSR